MDSAGVPAPRGAGGGGQEQRRGAAEASWQRKQLVQGELCHFGRDELGRDACGRVRGLVPGEKPLYDFSGLTVSSCKAFPGRSQVKAVLPTPGRVAAMQMLTGVADKASGPFGLLCFSHTHPSVSVGASGPGPPVDTKLFRCSTPLHKTV